MSNTNDDLFESDLLIQVATDVVAAYVGNNRIPAEDLPALIKSVHGTFAELSIAAEAGPALEPAVPIDKSITRSHIICLEDGKKLKMLKRYLRTHYGMTPDDYRAKWGLPKDYPMVSPGYSAKRSAFAKEIGLGKKRGAAKRSGGGNRGSGK